MQIPSISTSDLVTAGEALLKRAKTLLLQGAAKEAIDLGHKALGLVKDIEPEAERLIGKFIDGATTIANRSTASAAASAPATPASSSSTPAAPPAGTTPASSSSTPAAPPAGATPATPPSASGNPFG